MNVDKLLKAIQILVKEEVRKQLPKVIEEVGNKINESNAKKVSKKIVREDIVVPNNTSISKAILEDDETEVREFTKNPILNEVLNETAKTYTGAPSEDTYAEWPTMNNPLQSAVPTTPQAQPQQVPAFDRTEIAAKMGYGDMAPAGGGVSPTGLGIKTGLPGLDRVLNRDNRELIRAMEKKKNFRPGT